MWALVSLYVLAHVAAGLIEAGLDPSRPRGFRVFDCLGSPYMNNFRSCATFSHRRSARMGPLWRTCHYSCGGQETPPPPLGLHLPSLPRRRCMTLLASSGPRLRPRGVILFCLRAWCRSNNSTSRRYAPHRAA